MNTELLVGMCESKIQNIEDALKRINKDIIDDGMSDELALELAKNRISLEYAKAELQMLKAQLDDERKYFQSKEYRDAVKELDALAKRADDYKKSALSLIDDAYAEIQNWEMTVHKHKKLARDARVETENLKASEVGKIGNIYALQKALFGWKRVVKLREDIKIR